MAAGAGRTGTTWALVSARAEGISIHTLAAAAGLSPSRVHQLVADAGLDALDAALGELRAAGWPAPEHPDSGEDAELGGRDTIADRLTDEVSWLRQCAGWLAYLGADGYPPAVNLRPSADWPDRAVVAVGLARVRAVIGRIAADVDELARARRVQDLNTAAVLPDPRAERRRRLAEPDLGFRVFCARRRLPASSAPQLERAWDAWQAERYERGEISQRPGLHRQPVPATLTTTTAHTRAVQETGRHSGADGSIVTAPRHELAVADLITELQRDRYHGLSVVAACVAKPSSCREVAGVPVHGGLDDITAAVRTFGADTVVVLACPEMDGIRLRSLAWKLEKTGTELCVAPALLDVSGPRTTIRPTAGFTLLHVDHPQLGGGQRVLKGLFDRCGAAVALIMLAPLMLILAAAIWLSDRGPALFTQDRVGKNGRTFRIYKFRTMVVDSEQRRAQMIARDNLDGILFKLRRDPRVTAVGAHLRRWSLDELPQLFNVLRGDMSLVGPRPALPDEAARYAEHVRRRLVVKPGLTGLWQVNGRSDLSWEESVRLDLRYVENWSFAMDLQILWKTISIFMRDQGRISGCLCV